MTDAELLLRVQRGDLAAWDTLYARCLPTVWRYACALTQDASEAEEIVAETFLAFVRNVPTLDAEAVRLHGWLRGIVRHKALDQCRQSIKHRRLLAAARDGARCDNPAGDASAPMELEEQGHVVLAVLERLPDLQRLVLEWKHAEELSVREIAERLDQTEKSIESLLYRARKEFRRIYEIVCADDPCLKLTPDARASTLEKSV